MYRGEPPLSDEVRGALGRGWMLGCLVLAAVGVIAFLVALSGGDAQRAWQVYLANFLFWTGLGFGSVMFSATLTMTNAKWGRPLKRLAEAFAAFLPVSLALFLAMYAGRAEILPWVRAPIEEKAGWLSAPFLFARNGAGLFLLTIAGLALVYLSVRKDLRSHEPVPSTRGEVVLSPIFGILYGVFLSLLAFDLVMSLDPHWRSTLLGAYYFTASFYTALGVLLVAAALAARSETLRQYVGGKELRDLATLFFAFNVATAYMFYAQLLTIWYGNLPAEGRFPIERLRQAPWEPVAWTVLALAFAIPFAALLSRKLKSRPIPMLVLAIVALVGMWLERFVLVAPSLWKRSTLPLGWLELFVSLGFLGVVGFCVTVFLRRYPMVPVSDPMFHELLAIRHEET